MGDLGSRLRHGLAAWWRQWRVVIGVFAFAALTVFAFPYLPDRYDPSTPIDLTAEATFVTPLKLARINNSFPACVNAVRAAGFEVSEDEIESSEPGCGMARGLHLEKSGFIYAGGGSVRLTCPMMAALARWEIRVVAPLAEQYLGSRVARVIHYGTYSCRNVNGSVEGRRSAHATAQAIDVAGFLLEDGREVSLSRDWEGDGDKALFLRAVRDASCDVFRTVLSPDYNDNHRDHFHFERGRWGICR
jgi:hypothetical protein